MKFFFLVAIALCGLFFQAGAQEESLHETGRSFLKQGDFDNAIVVLNRALEQDKKNIAIQTDLVQSYYYKRNYAKALEVLKPLLDNDADVDVVTYQLGGNIFKALEEVKEAEKMYKKALKRFPNSGPLYSEYGELLFARKDPFAIDQWEKGIKADPSFSGNYYNAALFYANTKDKIWTIIYGEVFVNMESLTERGLAMKKLVLDAYKEKLFAEADLTKDINENKSEFAKAYLQAMSRQSSLANRGLNAETLTMIRARFILDWYTNYANKFPFRLFDYHRQLLQEGMFDAYNQWLFGTVENLAAYENWTKTHSDAYTSFSAFQKGRIFKMPAGQYYQDK
ncbi:tetratricopeptide repeat protein [Paraflavisolibacter sp. H34]|uniref:tetratricopeptide repeat protein n=1 Tax=Huijunlia imazamoxiresistens TaxID=3127457 RepID=UPI003018EE14